MPENIDARQAAGMSDLAHVDAALEGQGTIIGGLQSALAGAVDAQLAANQQGISSARARLTKTANKASKGQAGMVNGLAGMLGETIAASIAPGEQAQQQIGAFAATRAVPPVLPRRATTGTATAPASGGAIPPPPPPPLPSPTLPTLTSGYLADPACLPQIQVDGQLGGTFPDPPDTANLPAGMDRWYIWTACNPPPNESQSHVHPTSAWIFEDPITHTSPAQRLINEGYIYLGYLNIGLSNQATQFPLANQIIAYYLQCACNPTGGGGGPPALPPIPPPALPPIPPPALPPAIPPPQVVTADPVSGAFCVCPLVVPPLPTPPAGQTITKGFEDIANWLADLGDSILRAGSTGADYQPGGREWIDACVWDPLARLVVRHFDQDDGPTADVIRLMANSQSCLLSNIFTAAVSNYMPGLYPDKARAVMAVRNVLESLLAASVEWASSGSTSYHVGVGLDAAGSIPPPAKPPRPPKAEKKSKSSK